MNEIKVKDILEICNAKLLSGDEEEIIENFKKDSREVEDGDTYVGIKGKNFNGSDFFEKAFEAGAKAAIIQDIDIPDEKIELYKDKVIIKVRDCIEAIQKIAIFKREKYDIPVIGVTGSVGKTSTKDIIASVMSKKYKTVKTEGNYNNHIGVPLTILKLKDHTAAVIEMGMNHLGEISKLTKIARPTMSVITNVGTSHIGELGSRENILKAKLEILEGMNENAPLAINNDNDMLHNWYMVNQNKRKIVTFGIDNESDIMAKNIVSSDDGSKFKVNIMGKDYDVEINVGGKHFIINSLCAICVGLENGIEIEKIIEGIKEFKLTKRRMEIKDGINNSKVINDSYNASYDSMKAAIEYLGGIKANKRIAVLGDMLELGEYEKELHEKVGEEVYKNNIDFLVTVGERAKWIASKAKELGMSEDRIFVFDTKEEACEKLKNTIEKGDFILVKASNSMKFDKIVEAIITDCHNSRLIVFFCPATGVI